MADLLVDSLTVFILAGPGIIIGGYMAFAFVKIIIDYIQNRKKSS